MAVPMVNSRSMGWLPPGVSFAASIAAAFIAARQPGPSPARDTDGATIFRERCAACHSIRDEAGQGPGLGGVVGRRAATGRGFGYSRALRQSALVWSEVELSRFLESPARAVPGTTMPVAVPDEAARKALIAYLATLPALAPPAPAAAPGPAGPNDFRSDAPGRVHRVALSDLPAPYASPSARNAPVVVDRPAGAALHVPPGFAVELFASNLYNPRLARVAPNGDIFVAETGADQIRALRAADGASRPAQVEVFASSLDAPFGIAFLPAKDPEWIYVADRNAVVRFPYRAGDLLARGAPETVVAELAAESGGHTTRDVAFSPDETRMFVSVGSGSNVAEGMRPRPTAEHRAPNGASALGATWGDETDRADVLSFDPDGNDERIFATGIRNCVGFAVNAATGDLWCSTNERDGLGDDLVPDYVTRVRDGAFYGWPWYYLGAHEDPRHAGERPDLAGAVTLPDVLLQAHSAPLAMAFYEGAMFPPDYEGSAFVALHGSWNRGARTGPKVIRVFVKNGVPRGDYEDFLTGFAVDDATVWGRPVGVAVAHDGALLVTEDGNGTLWRVTYRGKR
ncbi:MAG TPA: PQQ-dependent sugar dehydrogenase [Polyangiaceae bacterium]|jgi:glucose/arabinose dehydrogenase|nr:PQQ-dependent sugar dehydrogenase [Polyangiaceae bacterium]